MLKSCQHEERVEEAFIKELYTRDSVEAFGFLATLHSFTQIAFGKTSFIRKIFVTIPPEVSKQDIL